MSADETIGVERLAESGRSPTDVKVSPLAVGVIVWLASELMFFSGLFAAYFTLRVKTDPWPPPDVELATVRASIATAVLIVSSLTMHFAVASSRRHDRAGAARWLSVTLVLGLMFIANQALEYVDSTFSISSHAYGSMFFLMTGFHGLHVIGGLIFMAAVIWVITGRTSRAPAGDSVEVCAYYWHFVDLVWVVMFANLYLLR